MAASSDDELAAIRAQRMQALQDQLKQQAASQLEAQEEAEQKAAIAANLDAVMRRSLTPEARSRLARIALVEPERCQQIKSQIAAMVERGAFHPPMSDASLKQLLSQQSKSRNNASIRRI